jgi:hypothetical protein
MVAFSLIVAARIASARENWLSAAELHAQADLILDRTGIVLYDSDRRVSEEMLDDARQHLGEDRYAAAQAAGRVMELPATAALADSVFQELLSE